VQTGEAAVKLWLILTFLGNTVGTWGPLPYGMEERQRRAHEEVEVKIDASFASGKAQTAAPYKGKVLERKDIEVKCIESASRPELAEP